MLSRYLTSVGKCIVLTGMHFCIGMFNFTKPMEGVSVVITISGYYNSRNFLFFTLRKLSIYLGILVNIT